MDLRRERGSAATVSGFSPTAFSPISSTRSASSAQTGKCCSSGIRLGYSVLSVPMLRSSPLDSDMPTGRDLRDARIRHSRRGDLPKDWLRQLRICNKSNILMMMQSMLREYKASIFHALAHPTRIAIVEALRDGEISARAIQERLGVEQANLSQHLAILRSRQIVTSRKEGNQVFYFASEQSADQGARHDAPVFRSAPDTKRFRCWARFRQNGRPLRALR